MAREKNHFTCEECGFTTLKWLGQCSDCGAWNSLIEQRGGPSPASTVSCVPVHSIDAIAREKDQRLPSTMRELDRVLGGGIVPGSLILFGGQPGIGKSTLLLQVAGGLAREGPVLYVSGEESLGQIRLRGQRVGALLSSLHVLAETDLFRIEAAVEQVDPKLLIIDSIQTLNHPQLESVPGSVAQVREGGAFFLKLAKQRNIPVFLVGHVTKEGNLAGPKILEHLVDCVLYFEGDEHYSYRILRGVKNRFGPIHEVGVFQMEGRGLQEVPDPSQIFMAQRPRRAAGSAVFVSMEGTRPILVEVQALVSPTAFGQPQRMTTGVERGRVSMLLAVLEKKAGLQLGFHDVYVNVAGGLRLSEPAADMSIVAAVASSFKECPLEEHGVFCGELGLTGEVRGIPHPGERLQEAEKMGFRRAYVPPALKGKVESSSVELMYIKDIQELIQLIF